MLARKLIRASLQVLKADCCALNTEGISEALLVLPLKNILIPDYVLCCFIPMKYDFLLTKLSEIKMPFILMHKSISQDIMLMSPFP